MVLYISFENGMKFIIIIGLVLYFVLMGEAFGKIQKYSVSFSIGQTLFDA